MKIRELVEELNKLDPNTTVVLSRDEEGNGFSEFIEISEESGFAIVWPGRYVDLDEIEGFTRYDDDEEDDDTSY